MSHQTFTCTAGLTLENGYTLQGYHLAYHTYGQINSSGDNVVWIFHALTANSDAQSWWSGLAGPEKLFDPEKYFIVCVNMPGSCYGSIGPLDLIPGTEKTFYHDFPLFTIRDMVHAYQPLREHLKIQKIQVGIGGSMGGQQLLEWAIEEPTLFETIIPIATNAVHSPWARAFNASQRWCIEADPSWKEQHPAAGIEGMKIARSVALLSYRNYDTYNLYQRDEDVSLMRQFKSESYQKYQGEKLAKRFNAFSYYQLSLSMDAHHIGRGRGGIEKALNRIQARTLVISIESDLLFPTSEQVVLADHIPGAQLAVIQSQYGHDGFLLEFSAISHLVHSFLQRATDEVKVESEFRHSKKMETSI